MDLTQTTLTDESSLISALWQARWSYWRTGSLRRARRTVDAARRHRVTDAQIAEELAPEIFALL